MISKKALGFTIVSFLFVLFSSFSVKAATPEPSPAPSLSQEINSFELFWPITAGKVEGDSFYWLKILKENIGEALIFGAAQKSDYQVLRSTKRVVETEKLLRDGKNELGIKTLDASLALLGKAEANWRKAKDGGDEAIPERENLTKQLGNLKTFLTYLASKQTGDVQAKIIQNNQKVEELLGSL